MGTTYTEFVREWAKQNGVSYMCAIGKQGLKDDYKKSKQIVNKKGRAITAVNSYNEQGGFKPREKRTRKPKEKTPELKRRNTIELEKPIQLGLASMLAKKQNTEEIKRKADFKAQLSRKPKKRDTKIVVKGGGAIKVRQAKEARNREDMGMEDKNMARQESRVRIIPKKPLKSFFEERREQFLRPLRKDLPPNWIPQRSGDGRTVYFNAMTGRSQFEFPR
jgi:superfamily II DNA/RNA helicase